VKPAGFLAGLLGEARAIVRDPGAILILIAGVVIYALFYPVPYLPQVARRMPITAVDLDHSSFSRRLIRMADASELLQVSRRAENLAEAAEDVRAGRTSGVLLIPEHFERDLRQGRSTTVGAYANASLFLAYRQVLTGLTAAARTFSAGIEIKRFESRGHPARLASIQRDPIKLQLNNLFNPSGGYGHYVVPAVLILVLQQTMLIGIGMLGGAARERRSGVKSTPRSPAFLLGRATTYVLLYLIHISYYLALVYPLMRFSLRGEYFTVFLFLLPFLYACALLGICGGLLFPTRETAMLILLFTSLPALFLSGFSWPPEAFPSWLRTVSFLLPSTWGIEGFLRVAQMGVGFSDVFGEWRGLWVLATGYFLLAVYLQYRDDREALSEPAISSSLPSFPEEPDPNDPRQPFQ